jgi:hypothetical protein
VRQLIVGLLFILISPITTQAQNGSATSTSWPVTKRCLGDLPYPSLPPEKWTFQGVIFTDNGIGVRAIRTDVTTSYYVALDGDNSFAFDGSFSPDGKRFVYPSGTTEYNNLISNYIGVNALQIVSTDAHQEKIAIPWNNFSYSGVTRGLTPPEWLDNKHFISEGRFRRKIGIVDALTGDISNWTRKIPLDFLYGFSPDQRRALFYSSAEGSKLYDVARDQFVANFQQEFYLLAWSPDSNAFIAMVNEMDKETNVIGSLTIFDKNGILKDTAITGKNNSYEPAALSPNGTNLAFFLDSKLYVAELNTRKIIDLCFNLNNFHNTVAWSPDNTSFVTNVGGFPVIVNYETLEMRILHYELNRIWGWYPIS